MEKNMKNYFLAITLIGILMSYRSTFASPGERSVYARQKYQPEIVKWIGEVKDDHSSHTTEHQHELQFTRKGNGKIYDIVDSPELVKLHHETGKNYVLEIEA